MARDFQIGCVTSQDGTAISFRSTGSGPAVLVVPGAVALAQEFDGMAAELATSFSVATMDRRGHGASGEHGPHYCLQRELEDIEAVRAATGALFLVGHSFGGFLVLESLRTNRDYVAAAVYDPGIFVDEPTETLNMAWADRSAREFHNGKPLDAFVSFIRGVNPETTGKVPRTILKVVLPLAMGREVLKHKALLVPETIREHREAACVGNQPSRYTGIQTPVLFMSGKDIDTTAAGRAAKKLSQALPRSTLATFPKLDHFGMEKDPATIADALTAAFTSALREDGA